MAIVSVDPWRFDDASSEMDIKGRRHSKSRLVHLDSAVDATAAAMLAPDTPEIGDPHDYDTWTWCRRITARHEQDNPKWVRVTCEYSNTATGVVNESDDPMEREPDLQCYSEDIMEEMAVDIDGKPVVNTLGVPMTGVMRPNSLWVVEFSYNWPSFLPIDAQHVENTLNAKKFLDIDPGHVRLARFAGTHTKEINYTFWRHQLRFEADFHPDGWERKTLNAGHQQLVMVEDENGVEHQELVEITAPTVVKKMDEDGEWTGKYEYGPPATISTAQALTEDGKLVPQVPVGQEPAYHWLFFRRMPRVNWEQWGVKVENAIRSRMYGIPPRR